MEARAFPAVAPLNSHEIVVMGGRSAFNFVGDVLIFDSLTDSIRKYVDSNEEYLEFQAYGQ